MASDKAIYWLAVGVMAVGFLNSAVSSQGWLTRLERRSVQAANEISGQSLATLAQVNLAVRSDRCVRTQAAAARMRAKFSGVESAVARRQAEFARLQAEGVRVEAWHEMHFDLVPQAQNVVIEIPRVPALPTL